MAGQKSQVKNWRENCYGYVIKPYGITLYPLARIVIITLRKSELFGSPELDSSAILGYTIYRVKREVAGQPCIFMQPAEELGSWKCSEKAGTLARYKKAGLPACAESCPVEKLGFGKN